MVFRFPQWRTGLALGGGLLALTGVGMALGFPLFDMFFLCPLIGMMAVLMMRHGVGLLLYFLPVVVLDAQQCGGDWGAVLWQSLISIFGALAGCFLLADFRARTRFRLREVAIRLLLGGGALIFLVSSLRCLVPGICATFPDSMPAWHRFFSVWSAEAVGFMVMVPLIMMLREGWRAACRERALELLLYVVGGVAAAWTLYRLEGGSPSGWQFLLFPLVIVAALRIGQLGAGLVVLALATALSYFLAGGSNLALLHTQLFLLMLGMTGVLLAASREEEDLSRRALASERQKLDAILNAMPNPVFFEDASGRLLYANQAMLSLLGGKQRSVSGLFSAPVREHLGLPPLAPPQSRRVAYECTVNAQTDPRVLMCTQLPLSDGEGGLQGSCFVATDVTERLAAEQQLRLSSQVFENASEGIVITDIDGVILAVNPAFSRITQFSAEHALGKYCGITQEIQRQSAFGLEVAESLLQTGYWQGEMPGWRKSGEIYPAWGSISNVLDEEGRPTHRVVVFTDFSSRKEVETRLQFLAQRDPLTQLFNRSSLQDRLDCLCTEEGRAAVLFIDLDRFKTVNDALGHAVGDQLLQVIAQRLHHCLKERDFIARFGGDEFMVVLENAPLDEELALIAQRINLEIAHPCSVHGHELFVTSSIGISRFPQDASDASGLMKAADLAMYRAKEMGKNTYAFHTQEMIAQVSERGRLEGALHAAVAQNHFVLHYQPQFELAGEAFHGVEALLRWQHPELGMVPPSSFIPLAEETGMIELIGEWVIRESCRQMRAWLDQGVDVGRVAVNLSPRQFRRGHLLDIVCNALDDFGLEGERLELEITENALMDNPREASAILAELREMGVRIAVDDFGHGYSSLAYLKEFPLDTLKIDRSFIMPLPEDGDMAAIVEAVVEMATKLRLTVVAEGVESALQSSYLRHIGCTVAQGYYYSKPLPADQLPEAARLVMTTEAERVPFGHL